MIARPHDDEPRSEWRTVGIAILTACATTFATELARWAVESIKERAARRPGGDA